YLTVYVTLLRLTALTVGLVVARVRGALHFPCPAEVAIALGIATVMPAAVGWYFMHLIHANRLVYLFIAGGVFFLVVMIGLTWADYGTRAWFPWTPQQQIPR